MYKITFDGKQVELPTYTVSLAKKIEELDKVDGDIEFKLNAMYGFIVEVIGEEKTEELIGEFELSDPNLINILFLDILQEYNRPYDERQIEDATKEIVSVFDNPRVKKAVESLDSLRKLK